MTRKTKFLLNTQTSLAVEFLKILLEYVQSLILPSPAPVSASVGLRWSLILIFPHPPPEKYQNGLNIANYTSEIKVVSLCN